MSRTLTPARTRIVLATRTVSPIPPDVLPGTLTRRLRAAENPRLPLRERQGAMRLGTLTFMGRVESRTERFQGLGWMEVQRRVAPDANFKDAFVREVPGGQRPAVSLGPPAASAKKKREARTESPYPTSDCDGKLRPAALHLGVPYSAPPAMASTVIRSRQKASGCGPSPVQSCAVGLPSHCRPLVGSRERERRNVNVSDPSGRCFG